MNDQMTTVRLPTDVRGKLLALSKAKGKTKSDIIKESLEIYYEREENEIDSYTLGEPYFGNYGFSEGEGESDLATTYKERIKEKLIKRMSRTGGSKTGL